MSQMIALNVGAITRLTYAVAPAFVARGVGTIINVASIVAVHPEILTACMRAPRLSCSPSAGR